MEQELTDEERRQLHSHINELVKHISLYGIWILSSKNPLVTNKVMEYETQQKAAHHLVDYGFLIYRFDLDNIRTKGGDEVFMQLTEMGRDLKIMGSWEQYLDHMTQEAQKKAELEQDRRRDSRRNEHLFWINFSIAVSTVIAAVLYVFQLFDYYEHHTQDWQKIAYFVSGLAIGLILWLVSAMLRKLLNRPKS